MEGVRTEKTFDPSKEMILLLVDVRWEHHWGSTSVGPILKLEAKQTGLFSAWFDIPDEVMEWTVGPEHRSFAFEVSSPTDERVLESNPFLKR